LDVPATMDNLTLLPYLSFKPFGCNLEYIFPCEFHVFNTQCFSTQKHTFISSVISEITSSPAYRMQIDIYDPFISCVTYTHKKIEPIICNCLQIPYIWKHPLSCDRETTPVPVTPTNKCKTLKPYNSKTTGPFSTIFWGINALTLYFHYIL
jgi:hypothetical protein